MIDRTKAPQFVKPEYFPLQRAESVILERGIPFHFLNSGSQDILRLEIIFKAGKWYENKNGTSTLTGKLLTEGGTEKYNSFEISKIFEQNGAFFEINAGLDFINFSVYTLAKKLHKLIDVIEDILLRPIFSEKELETQKSIQIQNLKVSLEKNSFLASRDFRNRLFGDDHPYGKALDISDIDSIIREDLIDFYKNNIRNNFEIIVSGHFSDDELSLLQAFFGNINKFESKNPSYSKTSPTQSHHLNRKDSLQSSIRIGKSIINKHDPEYPALLIFNEVLGGYFGSRLMQNLREDKGFTYGVHSSIVPLLNETYFIVSTDVIKESRNDAVKEIHYEISRLIETKIDDQELNTVKNYFKGTFLAGINSPFSLADKFKNIHFHGLGYEFYKHLFKCIDQMDANTIQNFAEKYFAQNTFTEVVVG